MSSNSEVSSVGKWRLPLCLVSQVVFVWDSENLGNQAPRAFVKESAVGLKRLFQSNKHVLELARHSRKAHFRWVEVLFLKQPLKNRWLSLNSMLGKECLCFVKDGCIQISEECKLRLFMSCDSLNTCHMTVFRTIEQSGLVNRWAVFPGKQKRAQPGFWKWKWVVLELEDTRLENYRHPCFTLCVSTQMAKAWGEAEAKGDHSSLHV